MKDLTLQEMIRARLLTREKRPLLNGMIVTCWGVVTRLELTQITLTAEQPSTGFIKADSFQLSAQKHTVEMSDEELMSTPTL